MGKQMTKTISLPQGHVMLRYDRRSPTSSIGGPVVFLLPIIDISIVVDQPHFY